MHICVSEFVKFLLANKKMVICSIKLSFAYWINLVLISQLFQTLPLFIL